MAIPHSSRIVELLPAYALEALDGDELRQVEEHLAAGCPSCDAELARLASTVEALARLAAGEPGAGEEPDAPAILERVRGRLLSQLAAEGPRRPASTAPVVPLAPPSRAPRRAAAARWAWLAAAALLLAAGAGLVRQARLGEEIARLHADRARLLARTDALERRMEVVQAEAERLARTLSVIGVPGVQSVELAGMGTASRAVGRAYVNAAERRAAFHASRLPALGPDKSYELWAIDDEDRKLPAGVFSVDARGEATVLVDRPLEIGRIESWVVTIEPRGGRPQPTGPIALAG
jgi:Anti-sigma-K factor rskA